MSGLRFSAWICAALAVCAASIAAAQETRQAQPINPGQIFERLLRQQLQRPETTQAVLAGNAGWTDSGVRLERGARLQITAQGQWSAVRGSVTATARSAAQTTDANGYPGVTAPETPLPNANVGALIGRIGQGAPFLIGANYRGEASAAGPLMLAMNDIDFTDNQGRLTIAVTMTPPAPPQRDPVTPPQPETQTPPQNTAPETPTTQTPEAQPPDRQQPEAEAPNEPASEDVVTPPNEPVGEAVGDVPGAEPPLAPAPEAQATEPAAPASLGVPIVWVAAGLAAIVAALLLIANGLRAKKAPRRAPSAPGAVGARIAHDGRAGQSLRVDWKDGR